MESLGLGAKTLLALFPVLVFAGALAFGVDQTLAAQIFTTALSGMLALALMIPAARKSLAAAPGPWAPAALFVCVICMGLLSLSRYAPFAADPDWARASLRRAGTINVSATLFELIKLGGLACAFSLGVLQGSRRRWALSSLDGLLTAASAYALISLAMFQSGVQAMEGDRLSGGFLSANTGATLFGMLCILGMASLSRALSQNDMTRVASTAVQVVLFAACLILTASRTGFVATAVAGLIFVVWESASRRAFGRTGLLLAGGALALVGVIFLMSHNMVLWRSGTMDADMAIRAEIFQAHWSAFLRSPWTGYGLGSFTDLNNTMMTPDNFGSLSPIRSTHNVYLQWLEEAGVLGAAPMFLLIAMLLVGAIGRAGRSRQDAPMSRGLVCVSIVVLIHGMTDFALQILPVAALWAFLLGLQFAFGRGSRGPHRVQGKLSWR